MKMTTVEAYKGATIKQATSPKGEVIYCAYFKDGSWYGWCETINTVKRHIDLKE